MDNLTHSLIGAALGQAGLKRKTGLAMPALIIAANLPDIDAGCVVYGIESLAMRRGITHGPMALAILPLLLAAVLWGVDSWQSARGKRPEGRLPVHFGWLVALCYLGTFSHPLFDWFNVYGIRLLEPFSSQWFHADVLFIVDVWLWALLGFAVWFSRRRERQGGDWARPARIAVAVTIGYLGLNGAITTRAEAASKASPLHPRTVIALPDALARLQALMLEYLPGAPLMSRDNLDSMKVHNVAIGHLPGLRVLGVSEPKSIKRLFVAGH